MNHSSNTNFSQFTPKILRTQLSRCGPSYATELRTCFTNPETPSCIDLFLTNKPGCVRGCIFETCLPGFHKLFATVLRSNNPELSNTETMVNLTTKNLGQSYQISQLQDLTGSVMHFANNTPSQR